MKRFIQIGVATLSLVACPYAWATFDAGVAAHNMLTPTEFVSSFIEKVCGLIGVGFIFASFIQYKMHKSTPTAVPLSRCIMMLLLGLGLLSIPFFGYYARILNQV